MKTHLTSSFAGAACALLAFCATPAAMVHAQNAAPLQLELVTPQSESFALGHIAGKALHASNQEQLGTLNDFLIDPKTGQVPFAIVPSGAGSGGETYRLVPMSAIDANGGPDALKVNLGRDQWDKVGTMTEQQLQGVINVNPDQQQRVTQQFGIGNSNGGAAMEGLIRASTLRGHEIRGTAESFGTVEDVVIDFNNRRAAPMLTLSGAGQKFLVPFDRLQLTGGVPNTITTNLSRPDFQQLLQGQMAMAPTGFPSGQFNPGRQQAFAAINAVQQAIARDQSATGVQVVPESRLVLRGTVPNEQKKAELERAASQAAPGVRIDSELTVRSW